MQAVLWVIEDYVPGISRLRPHLRLRSDARRCGDDKYNGRTRAHVPLARRRPDLLSFGDPAPYVGSGGMPKHRPCLKFSIADTMFLRRVIDHKRARICHCFVNVNAKYAPQMKIPCFAYFWVQRFDKGNKR